MKTILTVEQRLEAEKLARSICYDVQIKINGVPFDMETGLDDLAVKEFKTIVYKTMIAELLKRL